jgi:hypothetical protein
MKFMDFGKNSLDWMSKLASVLGGVARKILNFEWHDVSASILQNRSVMDGLPTCLERKLVNKRHRKTQSNSSTL